MLSAKAKKALLELGLTVYEIKVYSSLIIYGSLTASELSKISKIPYTKIYDILVHLQEKGFIKVEESRPAKYYPVEPKLAFENLKRALIKKINKNLESAVTEFSSIYEKKGIKEKSDVWLVKGKDEIINRIKDILINCKYELLVSIPKAPDELNILINILNYLKTKDVKINILIGKDVLKHKEFIQDLKNFSEIRITERLFGGGIISDSKEVILLLSEDEKVNYVALLSDHEGLAKFAKNYFLYIWEIAKTL